MAQHFINKAAADVDAAKTDNIDDASSSCRDS